jgi:hypothetical protein
MLKVLINVTSMPISETEWNTILARQRREGLQTSLKVITDHDLNISLVEGTTYINKAYFHLRQVADGRQVITFRGEDDVPLSIPLDMLLSLYTYDPKSHTIYYFRRAAIPSTPNVKDNRAAMQSGGSMRFNQEHVRIGNRKLRVYVGVRGGKYIRQKGKFVPLRLVSK